jgi:MOSC domain-containing protein YiiM
MELVINPSEYTLADLRGTVRNLSLMWDWMPGHGRPEELAPQQAELAQVVAEFPTVEVINAASRPQLEAAVLTGLTTLHRAGRRLAAAGLAPTPATGVVTRLSVSNGGVPKRAVTQVAVDHRGVVGDRQASRQHHGRPWQALCLWADEVIDQFRAQGHPVTAGAAGENITVQGVDWASIRTGVQLCIGGVVCEVTAPTLPCSKNGQWFLDGDWNLMHHDRGPVSRAYAAVLQPGAISVGDPATVLP